MQTITVGNIDGASVITCKPPIKKPPPGERREYRLVPVEELSDDDAGLVKDGIIVEQRERIAELENDAKCLRQQIELMHTGAKARFQQIESLERQLAAKDAENGRLVQERRGWQQQLATRSPGLMPEVVEHLLDRMDSLLTNPGWDSFKLAVRKHYAPKFVFTGELGMHQVRYDSGSIGEVEVIQTSTGLEYIDEDRDRKEVNADGTFDGGRITGRVG